ncbi:MAG: DUF72 domain-containing protein [Bacteroidetes bacterium]|nr:DUF72 domain-containing protein [Bacteroidota bacterium]MCL5025378.1 DUF72 domain-containing protein [Chloroflexota bacterium]
MGRILIGTASWTDPTLLASGWYPAGANTAEERLQFYASHFSLVEVDSTYYSPPAERTASLWVERTPDSFVFNIKAFSLFTQHPTQLRALPKDVRAAVPADEEKTSIYYRDVPSGALEQLWRRFEEALAPLYDAGKLGAVLFQFPPWFFPGSSAQAHILTCQEKLPRYRVAVEFRNHRWMDERDAERTLRFLKDNNLTYVCVDEPQGFKSSVPGIAEATSDIGMLRMHGRNGENWEKKGLTTAERYRYLYSEQELEQWLPKIGHLAAQTRDLHVLFNNCYRDYAVNNAQALARLLQRQPSLSGGLVMPGPAGESRSPGEAGPRPAPLL